MGPGIIDSPLRAAGAIAAVLFVCGCADGGSAGQRSATAERALPRPAPVHAFPGVIACDVVESNGSIHVLLGKSAGPDSNTFLLSYARSNDGGLTWTEPAPIPTDHGPPTKMHRGDDPQIAAHGDRLMALWTAPGEGPFGSGPMATALSDDGGRSWRPGPAASAQPLPPGVLPLAAPKSDAAPASTKKPHAAHGTGPGYRFPAAAAAKNAFHIVWIHAIGNERSLRHARLAFGETQWSAATLVDPHICACCWNELRVEPDGTILALYRDQRPSDMSLVRSRDSGRTWQPAGRAGEFDWNFEGCPHVGGGVATVDGPAGATQILATVWTGNAGSTGAYVLRRAETGQWSAPLPLTVGDDRGRNTDIAALPDSRTAAAAWDQPTLEGGQAVFLTTTTDAGRTWSPPRRLSPPGDNASYPRLVASHGRFIALWTTFDSEGATALKVTPVMNQ